MGKLIARVALRSTFNQNFSEMLRHTVGVGKLRGRIRL